MQLIAELRVQAASHARVQVSSCTVPVFGLYATVIGTISHNGAEPLGQPLCGEKWHDVAG